MLIHKTAILFLISLASTIPLKAQDYFLNFKATGATTVISTVHVKNQSTGDTLSIGGDDFLRLTAISGTGSVNQKKTSITLSPNPANGRATLCLENFPHDFAEIEITDMMGRVVATTRDLLINDKCSYIFNGLGTGSFLVRVSCLEKTLTTKILSVGNSNSEVSIEREIPNKSSSEKQTVNKNLVWEMIYHDGESLMFTAKSSIYTTLFTDIPTGSKTEWFEFTDCTDADSNHYPVVRICNQTWMAQNLNVGKLDASQSDLPVFSKHCYNNRVSNCNIYGGLYTWYMMMYHDTTSGSRGICPYGWHVPTLSEWNILIGCLGGVYSGGKLKETDTIHWKSPNTGASNSSGFSALPGGDWDSHNGVSGALGITGWYWTSTQFHESNSIAYYKAMMYNTTYIYSNIYLKDDSYSVRCLMNLTSP